MTYNKKYLAPSARE
jgi:hypothetical protein